MMKRPFLAGIDVSAKQLVVAIENTERVFDFDNDEAGHAALQKVLKKHKVGRIAIEPTGTYGLDAMVALHQAGLVVFSINPKAARNFARAQMRRGKTDRVDARVLMSFGATGKVVAWTPPPPEALALRGIARRLQQVVQALASEKARLKAIDATTTTPALVRDSVLRSIAYLEQEAEALVDAAVALARQHETLGAALDLLTSIRGVAERTAIKLLAEVAVLATDLGPKQLVAMSGLDPRPVESGAFVGQRRISKVGNPHIRAALFMAAHNAILYEPVVKVFYEQLRAAGKHPLKAKVAVMRKLLHAMWGMLQSRTAFDPKRFRALPLEAAA
jgi:transposase